MTYICTKRNQLIFSAVTASFVLGLALLLAGCADSGPKTSASSTPETANANAAGTVPANPMPLETKEPERYSVVTTITVQPTGNAPQANVPPLQFGFAKIGADNRRVSFRLPDPVGEVVYIEKGAFKYLIFPARNRYVELDPNDLGFQLGNLMSPASAIERLKERTQYENLGTENLNGRMAIKYRFKGAADTRTQAGTVQADSIVYVDQETGLPLKSDIDTVTSSGAGAHVVTETTAIQLLPDPTQFDVPTGMNKVTTAELKQQVEGFVNTMRVIAAYLRHRVETPPPASGQQ